MKKCLTILVLCFVLAPVLSAQDAPTEPAWVQDTVWYELFVRSFYDSNGDGIGDLQGVIQKLDYLNDGNPDTNTDLGITGIWLMPIMKSPSYHGYDVTDYFDIQPDYGTKDDFLLLMQEAHKRGIKVIVDMVLNHTSSQNEWFTKSAGGDPEYADWYVWSDTDPGYTGPWNAKAWYPKGGRYYYAPFWSEMPDLNYKNQAVTDEAYKIVDFWLQDMGVDGFRLDAIKYVLEDEINGTRILQDAPINREWLGALNEHVHSVNPDAVTVGEIWDATRVVSKYMDDKAVDTAFAFDLANAMIKAAKSGIRRDFEKELLTDLDMFGVQFSPFTTNHDQNRLMNTLDSVPANKAAASLLLTIPGTPFIYYGEEIGMTGAKASGTDEPIRTPMQWDGSDNAGFSTDRPWTSLNANFADVNVAAQTDDPESLLSHYRALVHLRNAHPALRSTNIAFTGSPLGAVESYLRWNDDEALLVVVNLSDEAVSDYSIELKEGALAGVTSAEVLFGQGTVAAPTINDKGGIDEYQPLPELAPYSTLVIQLK